MCLNLRTFYFLSFNSLSAINCCLKAFWSVIIWFLSYVLILSFISSLKPFWTTCFKGFIFASAYVSSHSVLSFRFTYLNFSIVLIRFASTNISTLFNEREFLFYTPLCFASSRIKLSIISSIGRSISLFFYYFFSFFAFKMAAIPGCFSNETLCEIIIGLINRLRCQRCFFSSSMAFTVIKSPLWSLWGHLNSCRGFPLKSGFSAIFSYFLKYSRLKFPATISSIS